jgi:C4-dicarboxylate-specific signal transduction histidine kinase
MEKAVEGATMAADIVRHAREFMQKGEAEHTQVDINGAAEAIVGLMRVEAERHAIDIDMTLEPGLPVVSGNLIQIEQVILNFMRNAVDAIEASQREERQILVKTQRKADVVALTVLDTGDGIAPDAMPRLFDAFYTTKAEGMGIGLSISRSIIEAHEGRIFAAPATFGGASFSFELPSVIH